MSGNNGCPNDENDYEVGVREERARIVAWIRGELPRRVIVQGRPNDVHPRNLADAIERGEHVCRRTGGGGPQR